MRMKILFSIFATIGIFQFSHTQSLPDQWHFDESTKIMKAGDLPSEGLYSEDVVKELRMYFTSQSYWTQLTQNYNTKTDLPAKIIFDGVTYDSVGVRFKGQTSYSMNTTQKKSFNISMDAFRSDLSIEGYQTLNLNNSWTDASFMREVLYYKLIRQHTPSAKAGFVRLFINDQDWGIYQNVQQLNKDFLEEWYASNDGINLRADVPPGTTTGGPGPGGGAMWGDGTAAMNYLGADTATYKKYYTLKSSGITQPWKKLVEACSLLNQTPLTNLEAEAPKILDIDKILWHLASEIVFGDDDSYVFKGKMDYYLYFDPDTERWATYDYDANSTFLTTHATWSPFYNANKVNYPLLNKLLAVPAFRQRYLAHVRTLIQDELDETIANQLIDKYDVLIRDMVIADTKKPTTYTAYTSGLTGLKNYVKTRKTNLLANSEVNTPSPSISNLKFSTNGQPFINPKTGDVVVVTCEASFAKGIREVVLHYGHGFSSRFTTAKMHDDGLVGDAKAGDGIFSIQMPDAQATTLVKFYAEVIGNDLAATRSFLPKGTEHECMVYRVEVTISESKTVVINEFMATNTGIVKDEYGETEDWIELHNLTDQAVDLTGFSISDSKDNLTKYTFPEGVSIAARGYLIVWADEDGTQGKFHANFKLSQAGEAIFLLDKNNTLIDSVTFGPQTTNKSAARRPNGTGNFVIGEHTFGANNDGTSGNAEAMTSSFHISPNPVSDALTISGFEGILPITIFDSRGRAVIQRSVTESELISVSHLPAGLYFVESNRRSTVLVIQH